MLQHLPRAIGRALRDRRPGLDELTVNRPETANAPATIKVESPAFRDGEPIPTECTADGTGLSPPLQWSNVPPEATSLALIIEDADSPTGKPLVHAIVPTLPRGDGALVEGALPTAPKEGQTPRMGRNSFLRTGWTPPDPPPGHGPHRYAFEVLALDDAPALGEKPGRSDLVDMLRGRVLAKGCLIGTYERM